MYRDCKSDRDLSCSQALNASFFARIASFISWFHQGALISQSPVLTFPATLSRFLLQHSAADEVIADLNSSHSYSMSSDATGSCMNLDNRQDANCFLTSLYSKVSHLIRKDLLDFMFGQGLKVARNIPPGGDQLTIQHLASLERPAHQKTNLTKLFKNLSTIFDPY